MTDDNLHLAMQRATERITASDRLRSSLLQARRRRRLPSMPGWVVGAAALAVSAVLVAVFAFRPADRHAPGSPDGETFAVTGQLVVVGGPAPGSPRPVVGQVVAHHGTADDGTVVASVHTAADGSFSLHVPPGLYELTGSSPLIDGGQGLCTSRPFTVTDTASTKAVAVICNIK